MKKKYQPIYRDLVKKIQSHVWPVSSLLPSENELTSEYNTSRETIRKALDLLSQDGYIQKVRGKGSVVIDIPKYSFPVSGITSFKELADELQLSSRTIVQELDYMKPDHEVYQLLNATISGKVWKVNRVREIDREKIILDKDYFNEAYVPKLTEKRCEGSIYQYIEQEIGLTISFAKKEIIVEEATDEDRALLDLDGFSNIVVIKSNVYLEDASLFQYTESRHRPDKFRFVDFARRTK